MSLFQNIYRYTKNIAGSASNLSTTGRASLSFCLPWLVLPVEALEPLGGWKIWVCKESPVRDVKG